MKICFVVCPIGSEGSETRKRSDELLNYIIKPVCEKCGFEAVRVDNINASDSINNTILERVTEQASKMARSIMLKELKKDEKEANY